MAKVQKPANWKDGNLRSVARPQVLESKYNKINLLTQSATIGSVKKGKTDLSVLPEGVRQSIKTKKAIDDAIAPHGVQADEIRQRLNITGKPLTQKNVHVMKAEIEERFEANRKRTVSKGIDLTKLNKELSKKEQHDVSGGAIAEARKPIGKGLKGKETKKVEAKKPAAKLTKETKAASKKPAKK